MGCLRSAGNNYEEDDDGYNTLRINKNGLGKSKVVKSLQMRANRVLFLQVIRVSSASRC